MHDDDDDVGCFVLSDGATATDAGDQPTSAFADFTLASFVEADKSFIRHCRFVHCREDQNCAEHETWTDDSGRLLGATRAVEQDQSHFIGTGEFQTQARKKNAQRVISHCLSQNWMKNPQILSI